MSRDKYWQPGPDEEFYYVYFIECAGYVKIGRSEAASINSRLRCIASCCPLPMTFLGAVRSPPGKSVFNEKRLHIRFAKHAHKGEWFKLTDEVREFLDWHRCEFKFTFPPDKVNALIDSFRQAPRSSKEFYEWIF